MKPEKAKNASMKTRNYVNLTKESMKKGKCINPYAPFEGLDGKTYKITYPQVLNDCTNCYSFSLGIKAKGRPDRDYFPGFLSGYPLCVGISNNLEERVRADLNVLGRSVYDVIYAGDIPKQLPKAEKGTVWIKVMIHSYVKEDIHFMVKNEASGRWIHKLGWSSPPKVVVRNLKIKSTLDTILEMKPEIQKLIEELGEENVKDIIGNLYTLSSSILEYEDDSSYYSFQEDVSHLVEYKPMWVMRISE